MKTLIADIETDGLLDDVSVIHSIVYEEFETGTVTSCNDHGYKAPEADRHLSIAEGLEELRTADKIVYHNGIKYDIPVQQKLFPDWVPEGEIEDTLVMSRLIYSSLKITDLGRIKKGSMPGKLRGSHGLEAWGYRLKKWKGDYAKEREAELKAKHERMGLPAPDAEELRLYVWGSWNAEMQDYCVQDVAVTSDLYRRILSKKYDERALKLEHQAATLCAKIERNGFPFNEKAAAELYGTLSGKRAELEMELIKTFGTWVENLGEVTPKASSAQYGYWGEKVLVYDWMSDEDSICTETIPTDEAANHLTPSGAVKSASKKLGYRLEFRGYPYSRVKFVTFNPSSRHHIANRLKALYNWKPTEFTPGGDPKIDENVLADLTYPTAPLLNTYFLVQKRLGQVAEGNQGWLNVVKNGRIHGSINPNGAVTGRATHSFPNVAQVPKVKLDKEGHPVEGLDGGYGWECRNLFGVPKGWTQIGTDMSGLELRCLAHFMARWDDGEYGDQVLNGDIHTINQTAAGLPSRDNAKTFIYAFLYGAGDGKLGSITGRGAKDGKRLRANFEAKIPAMGKLTKAVKVKSRTGYLTGLDGRQLFVRSEHSALNTLLQSAGALLCKKWMVLMEEKLLERGYKHGWDGDFAFMAWVHDEVQIAARTPELAEEIGKLSDECARLAGEYFNFRILLEADYKVGSTWAVCH